MLGSYVIGVCNTTERKKALIICVFVEILTPNLMAFEGKVFGKFTSLEGEA